MTITLHAPHYYCLHVTATNKWSKTVPKHTFPLFPHENGNNNTRADHHHQHSNRISQKIILFYMNIIKNNRHFFPNKQGQRMLSLSRRSCQVLPYIYNVGAHFQTRPATLGGQGLARSGASCRIGSCRSRVRPVIASGDCWSHQRGVNSVPCRIAKRSSLVQWDQVLW